MNPRLSLLKRAQQGEPEAIAALMNRNLGHQNARVQVRRQVTQYQVLIEAAEVPNQTATVKWIQQGLSKLAIPNVEQVAIYGKAKQSAKPNWRQVIDLTPEINPAPTLETTPAIAPETETVPTSDAPVATHQTPATQASEPPLDLSGYCFIRNKSLLSGKLSPPSPAVAQIVLSFAALTNVQKSDVISHLDGVLRNPDQISADSFEPTIQAWLAEISKLEGDALRKLSIWLSRYCAAPDATLAQLDPVVAPATVPQPSVPEASTTSDPSTQGADTDSPPPLPSPQSTHSQPTPRTPKPQPTQKPMFAKGSSTPAWAIPTGWAICLLVIIVLGVRSANNADYNYPICAETSGAPEACMLAVQLAGSEDMLSGAIAAASPLTPEVETEAIALCNEYASYEANGFDEIVDPESAALATLSSQTEEIFPGVLLTDITQASQDETKPTVRVACVDYAYEVEAAAGWPAEFTGETVAMDLAADLIPMNWPEAPYDEAIETQISIAKTLGIYSVFINLGAYTLFTAIGLFIAVIVSSCYVCYSLQGIYKTAFVLGLIETGLAMIPSLGWFTMIPMEVLAIGISSLVVKEFNVDWTEGYRPLALGAMIIIIIRLILSLMLYGIIAYFVMA